MITAHSLTKRFGDTTAVDNLTFEVPPGVVTGFLGPNGSGKSTTMRMIMGLDVPTSGSALIGGHPFSELDWPLREVAALLDAKAFHPARTARNHLRWLALTNDIPLRRVDEVLDQVGLTAVANRRAGKFSLGMSQRLGIAATLLGDPAVLLFDEPVNGLDPEGIRWVRHFLRGLAAEGRTVFVSSHLISEMSQTADRLVVIGRGHLIAETSVADFIARSGGAAVKLVTPDAAAFTACPHGGRSQSRCRRSRRAHHRGPHRPADRRPRGPRRTAGPRTDPRNRILGGCVYGTDPRRGRVPPVHPRGCGRSRRAGTFTNRARREGRHRSRQGVTVAQAIQTAPPGHYRLKNVVRSEVVKILTLRSTALTLGITVAAALLVTGLVSNAALGHSAGWYLGFDPTQTSLTGLIVAGLTGGVFGALIITGEYSSGTIRASLAATPRRPILLTAKIGVTAAAVVVFCEILSFVSFFLGQAILSGQPTPSASELQQSGQGPIPIGPGGTSLLSHLSTHASLASPGAFRAVWMTGLFIALLALMSFGLRADLPQYGRRHSRLRRRDVRSSLWSHGESPSTSSGTCRPTSS